MQKVETGRLISPMLRRQFGNINYTVLFLFLPDTAGTDETHPLIYRSLSQRSQREGKEEKGGRQSVARRHSPPPLPTSQPHRDTHTHGGRRGAVVVAAVAAVVWGAQAGSSPELSDISYVQEHGLSRQSQGLRLRAQGCCGGGDWGGVVMWVMDRRVISLPPPPAQSPLHKPSVD